MNRRLLGIGLLMALPSAYSVQAEDFFFDSAGVRIHYTVEGGGEPVVLIHGFCMDIERNWAEPGIIEQLANTHRVIAIDLRGHGQSDKPHDPKEYGMKTLDDVVRLMDHLRIQKAHIVGYSMGGRITSVLLAEHPDRVRTAAIGGYGWRGAEGLRKELQLVAESLEQGRGLGPIILRLAPPGQEPPEPQAIEAYSKLLLANNDPLALAAVARGMADIRTSEAKMRANELPTLALIGEQDPNRTEVDDLARLMPDLKVVVIPGANHMTAFRSPEFIESLKTFLAQHANMQ